MNSFKMNTHTLPNKSNSISFPQRINEWTINKLNSVRCVKEKINNEI